MLYDDEYEYKSLSSEALPHVQLSHSVCVCTLNFETEFPSKNQTFFCFVFCLRQNQNHLKKAGKKKWEIGIDLCIDISVNNGRALKNRKVGPMERKNVVIDDGSFLAAACHIKIWLDFSYCYLSHCRPDRRQSAKSAFAENEERGEDSYLFLSRYHHGHRGRTVSDNNNAL